MTALPRHLRRLASGARIFSLAIGPDIRGIFTDHPPGKALLILATSYPASVYRKALRWVFAIHRESPAAATPPEPAPFLPPGWADRHPDARAAMREAGEAAVAALLGGAQTLAFPACDRPEVSVVVPVHNKAWSTLLCLRGILDHTGDVAYEVMAVDDASSDETARILSLVGNLRVIRHRENTGFVHSCNEGAAAARGEYLCFLNNDAVPTAGWLASLLQALSTREGGAAGGMLLYPDGRLQEAGSILWKDGSASGYGREDDPRRPEYTYLREVDFCSGACLLIRRGTFAALGGFDARYAPAYYEDADLCLRVRGDGGTVLYQPDCRVYHLEHGSGGPAGAYRHMQENRRTFTARWGAELAGRPEASREGELRFRDARRGRRILVVDIRVPVPPLGSGFPRAYAMLESLAGLGDAVTFFPTQDQEPSGPWSAGLRQLGVEVFESPYCDLRGLLAGRAGLYDVVVVSRPLNARVVIPMVRKAWPGVPIIYDAEALFCAREIQRRTLEGTPPGPDEVRSLIDDEVAPAAEADAVLTVSEGDRAAFADRFPGLPVTVWGHPITARRTAAGFPGRRGVLFVGGFPPVDASPNELAAVQLVREVWPRVRERLDVPLLIVGGSPPASVRRLAGDGVEVLGRVDDLAGLYDRCRVFVAPHRVAAGIPLKVLEAMANGVPCVVSELLAGQLGLAGGHAALVAHDPEGLAAAIVAAHEEEAIWDGLREGGYAHVEGRCDPGRLAERLSRVIDTAIGARRGRPRRPRG